MTAAPRFVARWELDSVTDVAIVVDVLRAFTTAAYALASGAEAIYLVGSVADALELGRAIPDAVVLGEDRGRRPDGFHLPNSPAAVARADLRGRTLVQRTSAGTQGVVAAAHVQHVFAASLVCASATAAAVARLGDAPPAYVITGRFDEANSGLDDLLTAELIERARLGEPLLAGQTAHAVATSPEAERTLALGPPHAVPEDIELATRVDAFDFAMPVEWHEGVARVTAYGPARWL